MKNSRRQLLFSSVSMLLVAVLSLSVATYAWFSNAGGRAEAHGISIKSTNESNIVLSHFKDEPEADWVPILNLDVEKLDLKPVSTVDCVNWFTAYSEQYNISATDGGRDYVTQLTQEEAPDYYIAKDFYIKSVTRDMIATYQIEVEPYPDFTNWEDLQYLRIALLMDHGDGTKTLSRFYGYDYEDNKGIKSINADGTATLGTVKITDYPTGNLKLIKETPKKLTLYVWYEGEDPHCIDTASGVQASIRLSFTTSGGENPAY